MATNGNTAHPDHADAGNSNNPSKDEVGWYFVEQYYTTLSKYPEKLHVRISSPSLLEAHLSLIQSIALLRQEVPVRLRPRS